MQQASDARGGRVFFRTPGRYDPLVSSRRLRGPLVWCLVAAALFGATPAVAKRLLEHMAPLPLAGLLYAGAALAALPLAGRGGSPHRRRQLRHLGILAGAVLAGGVVGPVLLLLALMHARAASVSLWLNLEAVATAALAYLLFREHLGWRTWAAMAAVVAGGAVLAIPAGSAGAGAAGLVALAALAWGLDNNLTSLIDGLTPAQYTAIKGAVAAAVNLGLAALTGAAFAGPGTTLLALLVGALGYGVSLLLYVAGAQTLGAARSQLAFASAPAAGLVVAWTWLGEPVAGVELAAAALMAVGVLLLFGSEHEHEHEHQAVTHSHAHTHDDGHHEHDHLHPGLAAHVRHTHEHAHPPVRHRHAHVPDLHHRHAHPSG